MENTIPVFCLSVKRRKLEFLRNIGCAAWKSLENYLVFTLAINALSMLTCSLRSSMIYREEVLKNDPM